MSLLNGDATEPAARPWLSVLMPVYNGEAYLEETLESVMQQDPILRDSLELLIADGGSSDRTPEIVRRFGQHLRVKMVTSRRESNWVARTNECLKQATGQFACTLHQDDTWHPDRLRKLRDAMDGRDHVAIFVHAARFIADDGRSLGLWTHPQLATGLVLEPQEVLPRLLVQNFLCVGAPVFRTSAAQTIGLFDEERWYTPDWDYWLRLFASHRSVFLGEALINYRIHTQSMTQKGSRDREAFAQELRTTFYRHIGALPAGSRSYEIVAKAGEFSIDLNLALVVGLHSRNPMPLLALVRKWFELPREARKSVWENTRIVDRLRPRLALALRQA